MAPRDLRSRARELFRRAAEEGAIERVTRELEQFGELLRTQPRLRAALGDITVPVEAKAAFLRGLLGEQLHPRTLEVLVVAVEPGGARRLRTVVSDLAIESILSGAAANGSLETVERELGWFAALLSEQSDLRQAITDPVLPDERKDALVREIMGGRAAPETVALAQQVALRTGDPVEALTRLAERAAERRGRVLARARTAAALTEEQERRLAAALSEATGKAVDLEVQVDPTLVGGVIARVGDEIIDGTVRSRLRAALERLTA